MPKSEPVSEYRDWVEKNVYIRKHRIQTTKVHLSRDRVIIGFVGSVDYGESDEQRLTEDDLTFIRHEPCLDSDTACVICLDMMISFLRERTDNARQEQEGKHKARSFHYRFLIVKTHNGPRMSGAKRPIDPLVSFRLNKTQPTLAASCASQTGSFLVAYPLSQRLPQQGFPVEAEDLGLHRNR